ncbi:methyltransferase domain-containing protein [Patescibacteria group bacterium]|jgi:pseudaminic acid biosynthesis-associated methylase|nr:methyltransferase domain-containing protein [Patescibacteria group bacterium]
MDASSLPKQAAAWSSDFGNAYVTRNPQSIEEIEQLYAKDYAVSRRSMNEAFLGSLDRSIRILEVGANIGSQLELLRQMGFTNSIGVDVNAFAVQESKRLYPEVKVIEGSAFALPFADGEFDLTYMSGVLIHISPDDMGRAMDELHRTTKKYIWGFEYYAPELVTLEYRGNQDLLWKRDFCQEYLKRFPDLKLVKEQKYPMTDGKNVSQMFLLEKA